VLALHLVVYQRERAMSEFYILSAVVVATVLWRLDRIGKQIEAVCANIKVEVAELVGNEERASETLREWKEGKTQAAKDTRNMLIFWGIIIALYFAWQVIANH
jgi:hypothetical protein